MLAEGWQAAALQRRLDMLVESYWAAKRERSPNPLLKRGEKYFSQNDEDGVLLEILRRIGLQGGTFVEIGVGNGLENNSLILLLHGWRGVWLNAEPLAFEVPSEGRLVFRQAWVDRENAAALVNGGLGTLGARGANVLGVDIDGNDLHVLQALLEAGVLPEVVVAEYNGKFPPPVRWTVAYDATHRWDGTDYQGASLQSFVDLCERFGYRLVACNITGINAFFVADRHLGAFADVPVALQDLFVPADYNWFVARGHSVSPRTVLRALQAK